MLLQRSQGLEKLTATLGQILSNLTTHLKNGAIDFIFTKIHGADLCKKIQTILTHRANKKKLIILNPIKNDRNSVLEMLFGDDINWITHYDGKIKFKSFATNSSMTLIKQQILKHRESILKSVTNVELNEVKSINNHLPLKSIVDTVNKFVAIVINKIKTSSQHRWLREMQ